MPLIQSHDMFSIAIALVFAASTPVVDSIRIESRWGGLGLPSATTYTIVRRDGRYDREFAIVPQESHYSTGWCRD